MPSDANNYTEKMFLVQVQSSLTKRTGPQLGRRFGKVLALHLMVK